MTPSISIVMAAKNYARFLPQAVDSVLGQTFADWELLIIDDGSTDATPDAVKPYLADSRIRCFRSDQLGQSRAKNLGIALSRGKFIAFLDADDAWLPEKLDKQLKVFEASQAARRSGNHQDLGVVFCLRKLMDESGRLIPAKPRASPPSGQVLARMFVQNFVCFSSAMVRREVFSRVGRFDPQWDLAIDYDLWLRVARRYAFDFVDEELVLYRTGHGNLSKKLADRVDTALAIMRQAQARSGPGELPPSVIAEGHASTCRTIGYVMRPSEPETALKWYWNALRWPHGRWISAKGLAASLLALARRKRTQGSPENATANH